VIAAAEIDDSRTGLGRHRVAKPFIQRAEFKQASPREWESALKKAWGREFVVHQATIITAGTAH
jgi:hypothetical protein